MCDNQLLNIEKLLFLNYKFYKTIGSYVQFNMMLKQGSGKVPSGHPGQVDFLARQVTVYSL